MKRGRAWLWTDAEAFALVNDYCACILVLERNAITRGGSWVTWSAR